MRSALLLLAMTSLAACDVLLPSDWGTEGFPCRDSDDCNENHFCEQANGNCLPMGNAADCTDDRFCMEHLGEPEAWCNDEGKCDPVPPGGFGKVCGSDVECTETDQSMCVCFGPEDPCRCTHPCGHFGACDGEIPGEARCLFTAFHDHPAVCARPDWTNGFGVWCGENPELCEKDLTCVRFEHLDDNICTHLCTGGCFPGMMCEPPTDGANPHCGYATWLGFGRPCADTCGPLFSVCFEGNFCTIHCAADNDCPYGAHCPNADFCLPVPLD